MVSDYAASRYAVKKRTSEPYLVVTGSTLTQIDHRRERHLDVTDSTHTYVRAVSFYRVVSH